MGVRQNPWTPTKRRGPIAAESSSPGPAVVSLPSLIGKPPQESRRVRAPAFTFGQKLEPPGLISKAGPGPATYNTEGMTAKAPNTYSMPPVLGEAKEGGKRAAPAFSITGRGRAVEAKGPLPGPGTYTTDKASTALNKRPPAYTIAPRRELRLPSAAVPGPGVYCPEKVCVNLPWAPAHTFGIRHSQYLGKTVHYPTPEAIAAN
ncbi:unnamed protein product [Arctia plantaginis]|nr:unnamed protein product [Arctia plantaginis]